MKLAYHISYQFFVPGYAPEDLHQEALLCLYRAAKKFDPKRKVKFGTYAARAMKNRLIRILESQTGVKRAGNNAWGELNEEIAGESPENFNDEHEQLREIFRSVNGQNRRALELLLDRNKTEDIGQKMGVTTAMAHKKVTAVGRLVKHQMKIRGIDRRSVFTFPI